MDGEPEDVSAMIRSRGRRVSGLAFALLERLLIRVLGRNQGVGTLEALCSWVPSLTRLYCLSREPLLRVEYDHVAAELDGQTATRRKVVIVGGGTIPVTAIYWATRFDGRIIVLEKLPRTAQRSRQVLKRLGLEHLEVISTEGEAYDDYVDSVALLSLHLTNKLQIANRALESPGRQTVCVRVLPDDGFDSESTRWQTIQRYAEFSVCVASS